MDAKEKELKTLLRRYGHRYFKEAHQGQNYDRIDEDFIPQILSFIQAKSKEEAEERYQKAVSELDWKSGKGKEWSIHDIRMALYTAAGLNRDVLGGEIDPTNKIITE